ncbi:unnamed protein product [Cercopithifilaria johnstoni]|uniref:Uncharacterized protein n=1 Tax=Cercopithifilaria johnstoni TaxID=2874296 RepID=A0A8J2Q3S9_9BILA|nr:unnamed protein product [Cercopithifilaria johnstoni]
MDRKEETTRLASALALRNTTGVCALVKIDTQTGEHTYARARTHAQVHAHAFTTQNTNIPKYFLYRERTHIRTSCHTFVGGTADGSNQQLSGKQSSEVEQCAQGGVCKLTLRKLAVTRAVVADSSPFPFTVDALHYKRHMHCMFKMHQSKGIPKSSDI